MNSREKGKRGEREFAEWLRQRGVAARRGQQFQGSPESPDVVTEILNVHIEVKRTERFRAYDALLQAEEDAGEDDMPIVAHRRSRSPWLAVLEWTDLLALLKEAGRTENRSE